MSVWDLDSEGRAFKTLVITLKPKDGISELDLDIEITDAVVSALDEWYDRRGRQFVLQGPDVGENIEMVDNSPNV